MESSYLIVDSLLSSPPEEEDDDEDEELPEEEEEEESVSQDKGFYPPEYSAGTSFKRAPLVSRMTPSVGWLLVSS